MTKDALGEALGDLELVAAELTKFITLPPADFNLLLEAAQKYHRLLPLLEELAEAYKEQLPTESDFYRNEQVQAFGDLCSVNVEKIAEVIGDE